MNDINKERMLKLAKALEQKKADHDLIKIDYKDKEKLKPLTTAQLLDRLEKLHNIT